MYFLEDLDEEDYEIAIKVVVVGNGAVGKSSMIQRYCKGIFTTDYKKTIGVDFLEKHITASGEDVRLMLWDTAGQEEFDAITKAYYRGAQACVVAFSTTDRASFDAVKKWKRKVEDECGHIPMVLVQNKIDLLHEAQVDSYEVEKFARNTGLKLFRTSVKENLNIARVFQFLSERHVEGCSRWSTDDPSVNDHDFSFQIGQNRSDVRVRFAGFPDDGGNPSSQNHNHQHNGKQNSGSRLRSAHNSLSGKVNNGGIFLHKQIGGTNNGCYSWHPALSSSASSSNNSSLVPSPPPEKTIILNPFRKRNRNKNKNGIQNGLNVLPWNAPPQHNNYHYQNGYHSYNGAQNNGYTCSQRTSLHYNNYPFSLQPQQHHQSTSQKPSCKMI